MAQKPHLSKKNSLWVFTSFAVINKVVGQHIQKAVERHLLDPAVERIVVISESAVDNLRHAFNKLDNNQVELVFQPTRPTFADLIAVANARLENGDCGAAAIMNADISFRSAKDTRNTVRLIKHLSTKSPKTALAITRYDFVDGEPVIILRNSIGLANIMSADTWVFCKPLELEGDIFYSPGQMFCDQFISHDLIAADYQVFNPCLDCVTLHHEDSDKDLSYYQAESQRPAAKESLNRHWKHSVKSAQGSYFGIPHVSSKALRHGYRPAPIMISERRKKIFLNLPLMSSTTAVQKVISNFSRLAHEHDCDLQILVHSVDLHIEIERELADQNGSQVYVQKVDSAVETIRQLLFGRDQHFSTVMFMSNPERIYLDHLAVFSTLFVTLADLNQRSPEYIQSKELAGDIQHSSPTLFRLFGVPDSISEFLATALLSRATIVIGWARDYDLHKGTGLALESSYAESDH